MDTDIEKQTASDKRDRWPRGQALAIAAELVTALRPACVRLEVAGSLRRGKMEVGDIELVYVPRFSQQPTGGELFPDDRTLLNMADLEIGRLEATGFLERRPLKNGRTAFGESNKLMRHAATGMAIDLFQTTEHCWFNYLVCRTGGRETNIAIANAAIARGWEWNPYGEGFTSGLACHAVRRERDVFEFVGLRYLEPAQRK